MRLDSPPPATPYPLLIVSRLAGWQRPREFPRATRACLAVLRTRAHRHTRSQCPPRHPPRCEPCTASTCPRHCGAAAWSVSWVVSCVRAAQEPQEPPACPHTPRRLSYTPRHSFSARLVTYRSGGRQRTPDAGQPTASLRPACVRLRSPASGGRHRPPQAVDRGRPQPIMNKSDAYLARNGGRCRPPPPRDLSMLVRAAALLAKHGATQRLRS